ncbi:hypothetical protein [Clostridium botulinum]|uniref:Uncharacterized protein n=1 Tax=Clostridium botulinum TaxID=1491 RepID=A0A6B4QJB7_CLOBO|nr:hypothetical protein [Clostridium botulinum]EES50488.1 hypothetical protein CLO_1824 [Clostridium botulinum E1 str. 'BoNT E Beluga']MBY6761888.1 hypothetical protein [Clostridium botulinum]MBY6920814.1 hypothetical protein [Clostridium botulinum]MCR1131437.1 hypothetical protein [Clostridium botulinum]NFG21986.1 hypothetical protein [Clostridium botulinum]
MEYKYLNIWNNVKTIGNKAIVETLKNIKLEVGKTYQINKNTAINIYSGIRLKVLSIKENEVLLKIIR